QFNGTFHRQTGHQNHIACQTPYFEIRLLVALITHVDGTARVQTVNTQQNPRMHALLTQFSARTGSGVLCNTSLNFNGTGFINRTSDLYRYCKTTGVDGFVYDDRFCVIRK
ncbi:hypothetical protein EVC45_42795, partial [Paraburkholderia sp. UYCP14C]|uniref:carbamoyltransferase C-terminal domain-containing protein n=1 Tax=Paraburkholderia sp. UYCP14C TaxID=2511130 RepID=UPI0010E10739